MTGVRAITNAATVLWWGGDDTLHSKASIKEDHPAKTQPLCMAFKNLSNLASSSSPDSTPHVLSPTPHTLDGRSNCSKLLSVLQTCHTLSGLLITSSLPSQLVAVSSRTLSLNPLISIDIDIPWSRPNLRCLSPRGCVSSISPVWFSPGNLVWNLA